jgi:hypothetical protein
MKPHPLADKTLPTRYFVVSSGKKVDVTPMARRRSDGKMNIVLEMVWHPGPPSEADLAELNETLKPVFAGFTPLMAPRIATNQDEVDKLVTEALLTDQKVN